MSLADLDRFAEEFRRSGGRFEDDLVFDVPERFNFARDVLDRLAEEPDKLALWWLSSAGEEQKVTFAQVAELSRRAGNVLAAEGVRRGDVVVVLLPRIVPWWVLNVACLRMGAVVSPGTTQLRGADIVHRLRRSSARCVIATPEVAARIDEVAEGCPELEGRIVVGASRPGWRDFDAAMAAASAEFAAVDSRADEVAAIYFTSGTEGPAKMVAHTHVSFPLRSKLTAVYWLDLREGDLHWNLSDTGWAKAGWSSLYGPWNRGAAVFAVDSPRFDPGRVLELLGRYPIDTLCAAPTVYRSLLQLAPERVTLRKLRHCVAAGEPLGAEVVAAWQARTGLTIRDGFGQTESSLLAVNFPGSELRPGSMGKAVPGYDVQVIDADGEVLADGQEGDLAVRIAPRRPLGLFKEYVDDPQANASAVRGVWHVTGDRAYRDDDGYFWFVGRADDVIISSGYRIGPFEVESALLEHPAVVEAAVVSSPDPIRGEVVKAFIVATPGVDADEDLVGRLQEHVKAVTAPYKYPRRIAFVDTLPKTVTGKIKRASLRQTEWDS